MSHSAENALKHDNNKFTKSHGQYNTVHPINDPQQNCQVMKLNINTVQLRTSSYLTVAADAAQRNVDNQNLAKMIRHFY